MALSKPRGQWTYEDLFDLPDDGKRYEIIDGELYEMPAPSLDHALILSNLVIALLPTILALGGKFTTAPVDVFIPGGNPVQPDFLVVLPDRFDLMRHRGVEGSPNLVVEVLSPSNPPHDLVRKRALYARARIPEYWIISPEAATVDVLTFDGAAYQTFCRAGGDEPVISRVLPQLDLVASALFDLPEQATASEK